MRTETTQIRVAKEEAIKAVKSTIDYQRLETRESMVINSHIEATINNLVHGLPTRILKGVGIA